MNNQKFVSDCCRKPIVDVNLCTLCYEWCYLLCASCFKPHTKDQSVCVGCASKPIANDDSKTIHELVLDKLGRASKE